MISCNDPRQGHLINPWGLFRSQAAPAVGKLLGRLVPPSNPGGVAGGPDRPLVPGGFGPPLERAVYRPGCPGARHRDRMGRYQLGQVKAAENYRHGYVSL